MHFSLYLQKMEPYKVCPTVDRPRNCPHIQLPEMCSVLDIPWSLLQTGYYKVYPMVDRPMIYLL